MVRLLVAIMMPTLLLWQAGEQHGTPVFHDLASIRQLAGAYTPAQIRTAYDFSPLYDRGIDGAGQSVALIEIDSFNPADIRQFDATYGLPDPAIQEHYVGGRFIPERHAETTMDIEWLHALAPGAGIQVYYIENQDVQEVSWRLMASALRLAASNGARVMSISLGACGPSHGYRATALELAALLRRGVSVFVASGDYGAHAGPSSDCGKKIGVSYPTGDPSVVSVGGTSLQLADDDTIASEVAWRFSGGGRVRSLSRAPWQTATTLPRDGYRWAPDVAFVGDEATPVRLYYRGRWRQAGGTSLGAPAWAAIWALIGQQKEASGGTLGAAGPLLYRIGNSSSYGTAMHDITVGSNGRYRAKPGWDAVTGWGTPDAAALAGVLAKGAESVVR